MPSSAFEIEIRSEIKKTPVSLADLEKTAGGILKMLGWKKVSLSVLLVGDKRMRALNQQYLHHGWSTDVLAFGQGKKMLPKKEMTFLGDIVICLPMAKRQSRLYGNSYSYELCFYLCHGILHLMGYNDKTKLDAQRMGKLQAKILKKIGVKNPKF